jgi:hypothetical protein
MDKKISTPIVLTKQQKFWLEHSRSCEAAGDSYQDYAKRHDLNISTFHVMRRRLRLLGVAVGLPKGDVQRFKKIPIQPKASTFSEVRLCFPNGVCVELSTQFDGATFPIFLQTVAQLK